ncbi:MAG TPA: TspO/MBR family protein [Micromonosporaceae bacterium]|jgi:tryptophan-rich sensory protein
MRVPTLLKTGLAVAATAAVGAAATTPNAGWYRRLNKPSWQPPAEAFGPVWTGLYALLAVAGARAIERVPRHERTPLIASYAINLGLNAGWTAAFFRARQPRLALAEIALLNASNIDLLARMRRADGLSAALTLPYAAWTGFATALNASIARRNPMDEQ